MKRSILSLTAGFAVMLFVSAAVWAQTPGLTKEEAKCQQTMSKALGKFAMLKAKCLMKCDKDLQKGKAAQGDCEPPFDATSKTDECVQRADEKARALITKKCATPETDKGQDACPECYNGGGQGCETYRDQQVDNTEAQVDLFVPLVMCDDSASGDGLTSDEAKCRQAMAKEGGKFAMKKGKCHAKCRHFVEKGKVPPGSCTAGSVTDSKTLECIANAELLLTQKVDAKCVDAPECVAAIFGDPPGSIFTVALEIAVDATDPDVFCGSPSGAFLEMAADAF